MTRPPGLETLGYSQQSLRESQINWQIRSHGLIAE
jgi:hypothetical protein